MCCGVVKCNFLKVGRKQANILHVNISAVFVICSHIGSAFIFMYSEKTVMLQCHFIPVLSIRTVAGLSHTLVSRAHPISTYAILFKIKTILNEDTFSFACSNKSLTL